MLSVSVPVSAVAAPENFLWGALRGQKSKKLPKMADFGRLFFSDWGGKWGAEPPTGGGGKYPMPPPPLLMPPLGKCTLQMERQNLRQNTMICIS